jgi:hypothetical protein
MTVITINRVGDKKRIIRKKWRAEEAPGVAKVSPLG